MPEIVVFNGVKFRRYPESKRRTDAVYFTPGIADKKRGVKRLHEEIWMAEHGPIPEGHHIHHVDGDPLNNDPANLQALSFSEHGKHHAADRLPELRAQMDHARAAASKWHGSSEGIEWHREHGRETWAALQPRTFRCVQCSKAFQTKVAHNGTRFCSNKCKTAWRRDSGVDDEQRTCVQCGSAFTCNRYVKKKTCSTACAGKLSAAVRKGKPQRSRH